MTCHDTRSAPGRIAHATPATILELDTTDQKLMNKSRMKRIARGSGCQVKEVVEMFRFKPFFSRYLGDGDLSRFMNWFKKTVKVDQHTELKTVKVDQHTELQEKPESSGKAIRRQYHTEEYSTAIKKHITGVKGDGDLSRFMNWFKKTVKVDQHTELKTVKVDQHTELQEKQLEGNFTLRSMQQLYKNILDMRLPSQVLSMLIPNERKNESQAKIRRYLTMMDSITNEELDSTDLKLMKESRIMQIARGSGRQVSEVFEMFQEYKRLAISVSKKKKVLERGDMSMLSGNINNILKNKRG
ncbi:signal recognition particle 54 kDa protein 2 [Tanacetum coccineum]